MQRLDRLGHTGPLRQQATLDQGRPDLGDGVLLDGGLLLHRPGQQAQAIAQRDVLESEVAGRRRQVVGGDRREAQVAVLLRRQRPAVLVPLEPQDRRAQDPALAHVVADPGLDHAEVLAHHDGSRALGLQHEDADERLVVVAHVGAFAGRVSLGDPPEAEQADDVVDADAAGVLQDGAEHVAVGRVAELGETVGPPWRLVPVLSQLVELVGRCPHRHPAGQRVGQAPGVGPAGVHADRQVVHDPERHPGRAGVALHGGQLAVEHPLQPAVEVDLLAVALAEARHGVGGRVLQR